MKTMMKSVAVAGLIAMASSTYAAGFMLTEQSASSLGRAYAGAGVDGTDISGVFYNPAPYGKRSYMDITLEIRSNR